MCKNKVKVFESKPTVGGFEKKNLGSPKGIGILAPIVLKSVKGGKR
jgi:hypothetical protein